MKLIESRQQILLGLKKKKRRNRETKETKGEVCLHLLRQICVQLFLSRTQLPKFLELTMQNIKIHKQQQNLLFEF